MEVLTKQFNLFSFLLQLWSITYFFRQVSLCIGPFLKNKKPRKKFLGLKKRKVKFKPPS
jgi:hypothetical protein